MNRQLPELKPLQKRIFKKFSKKLEKLLTINIDDDKIYSS
ncbi:hypothetical protein HMPREF1983_01045 [Gemella bergeri ATCC 700627]|uniref:Uncharacterized protein n=1 Tax=Gemella bergeri ATCC 700627 TaxID=1321820 RepID=U2QM61_9BACL|nr:hypothetical protein HMPREF1983_01045 [Gemella bergeri ATCC 700627]